MDTIVDDLSNRLALRLRLERDSRGWSLADLAERSGVSKATISKIERAEVSPTAVVLVRLASAFDLTMAGLMLRAEGQGDRHSKASEQPVWRDPETGYLRRQMFNRPDHPIEIIRVELPARQLVTLPASSYAHIRQVVWVEACSLVIIEAGEREVEGTCQPDQHHRGRADFGTLDLADSGLGDPGSFGEIGQRPAAAVALQPQAQRQPVAEIVYNSIHMSII